MNLLHLHYFYVVAQEQGFTKAARALRIQQPAISRMVKLLEEDLGVKLFEKVGRSVQLTTQGEEVFSHCRNIFGAVENLKQSLGQISGECKGPLKIAAAEPIASHFLPFLLPEYLKKYPKVIPQVFSGTASLLLEQIAKGDFEFGLFFHTPELSDKLEVFHLKPVPFHLVIRKDLRKRKEILESFIGSREIDDVTTRKFPTLERLKKEYPQAQIKISSNNLTAHRQMVLNGLGVAILPDFLIREDLANGNLVELFPKENFQFQMKFIKRKTALLSESAKALLHQTLQ